MGQPIDFKKRKVAILCFHKKKSLILKYPHIVAKEDPQAWTVGSQVVHNGSQLLTGSSGYNCRYRKALYFGSLGISLYLELFCFLSFVSFVLRKLT